MAITKLQAEALNLADTYAFTGTVTGAGDTTKPSFSATFSGDQTISDATWTKLAFDTEIFDSDSAYDASTNYRFTPQTSGNYLVMVKMKIYGGATNALSEGQIRIYKNGSSEIPFEFGTYPDAILHNISIVNYGVINMNGSSDYIEAYGYGDNTGQSNTVWSGKDQFFTAFKLT
jgi:hypothetical protein